MPDKASLRKINDNVYFTLSHRLLTTVAVLLAPIIISHLDGMLSGMYSDVQTIKTHQAAHEAMIDAEYAALAQRVQRLETMDDYRTMPMVPPRKLRFNKDEL